MAEPTRDFHATRRESVVDYLDGALSPEERTAFEAHLEGCPDCRATLARAKELLPAVEALWRGEAPMRSADELLAFAHRAEARLRVEGERRGLRRLWPALATAALAGAAVLALLLWPAPALRLVPGANAGPRLGANAAPARDPVGAQVNLDFQFAQRIAERDRGPLSIGLFRAGHGPYLAAALVRPDGTLALLRDGQTATICGEFCPDDSLAIPAKAFQKGSNRLALVAGDRPIPLSAFEAWAKAQRPGKATPPAALGDWGTVAEIVAE